MSNAFRSAACSIALTLLVGGSAISPDVAARQAEQGANGDALTTADFMKRVSAYLAIHLEAERAAPRLPQEATPQQIHETQRGMATRIQAARAGTRRGDIFTPEMTALVKRLINRVFAGSDRLLLRSSIMDENVKYRPLRANQLYPDEIPLASMPPDILKALPELPEEMEYRFVGNHFILFDQHAHVIPDFIPNALPGK